jgi:competence protein ComEC
MKRPLFVLALAWISGVLLSSFFPMKAGLTLLAAIGVFLAFDLYRRNTGERSEWMGVLLCASTVLLGYLRAETITVRHTAQLLAVEGVRFQETTRVRGRIETAFEPRKKWWRTEISSPRLWDGGAWRDLPGRLDLLLSVQAPPSARAGDVLNATGTFKSLAGRTAPGGMDWRKKNESRGIVGTFFSVGGSNVTIEAVVRPGFWHGLIRIRDGWRREIERWMTANLPPDSASLVFAMTAGGCAGMSRELEESLIRSGLYHLTSISGLHVTALLVSFPWFLKLLGVKRRWRAVLGLPLGIVFLVLVGARIPVIRATTVGMALMLGTCLDRPLQRLNLLGGAALLILVVAPGELWQPGFQLSFSVICALLLWGWKLKDDSVAYRFEHSLRNCIPPCNPVLRSITAIPVWLASVIWTSAVAVLAGAPITACHFHQIAWNGIFANIVGVPLAVATTWLGMLATFGMILAPPLVWLVKLPLEFLAGLLVWWTELIGHFPWGFSRSVHPNPVQVTLVVATLLLLQFPTQRLNLRFWNRRITALVLVVLFSWWPVMAGSRDLCVYFLDVGQGDACLLRFPGGESVLVDTGPPTPPRTGQPGRLADSLLDLGVLRLDAVVITHPEADHYGGLPELVGTIPIGTVLCNGESKDSEPFRSLADLVSSASIPIQRLLSGDRIEGIKDASLTVLNPTAAEMRYQMGDVNDRSVVLFVEHAGLRLLLTGDIGSQREFLIGQRFPDIDAHILKVAHHGSGLSTTQEFLRRVRPEIAVVCCGKNSFGHPQPAVLERLAQAGAEICVTQVSGTVEANWNGRDLRILEWNRNP